MLRISTLLQRKQNWKKDERIATLESEISIKQTQCKECSKTFTTNMELKDHEENVHNETVMILRNVCKYFIEEKAKHKQICERAGYCEHKNNCSGDCYFTSLDLVEDKIDDEVNTSE